MTHRAEIEELAAKVNADVYTDASGKISRVSWGWNTYGDGCLLSLVCFAEKARTE